MKLLLFIGGLVVAAAVILAVRDSGGSVQTEPLAVQGPTEDVYAADAASLERRPDGVTGRAVFPVPEPGGYEYPTADQNPEWAPPHPEVSVGSADEPEAFTMWIVIFNHPDQCTDGSCGADDFGDDTPARGGIFQADGRIVDGDSLDMGATIRLGEEPVHGSPFENPLGAEIHFAIAPHGKALQGADLWRQLNGPLGNPSLWWSAAFAPAE